MKTTEQLQELLSVAERAREATSGHPWRRGGRCGPNPCSAFQPDHTLSAGTSVIAYVENSRDNSEAVFVHCAAFDPTTCAELVRRLIGAEAEVTRLRSLIGTPHTDDFMTAVPLEAAHQVKRWGVQHDQGKAPLDWFWLIGYLAQKAATAALAGDNEKAKHHTISTAAVLLNWFRRLVQDETTFQPGVDLEHHPDAAALENQP